MVCGGVDVHQTGERRPMISNRAVWQQRGCGLDDRCVLVPVRTHEVITIASENPWKEWVGWWWSSSSSCCVRPRQLGGKDHKRTAAAIDFPPPPLPHHGQGECSRPSPVPAKTFRQTSACPRRALSSRPARAPGHERLTKMA